MKRLSLLAVLLSACSASAAAGSQVMLAQLEQGQLEHVDAISPDSGYNNQPLITEHGLYYTGEVVQGETRQMDIFFYDFASGKIKNITNSSVSEYSPTLTPQKDALSLVVVEQDGTQKLWQYPLTGNAKPSRFFEDLNPVGYHAWGERDDLILFMVGEPHTLQYSGPHRKKPVKVSENIGRTLSFNNQRFWFSEYHEKAHWLVSFKPGEKEGHAELEMPADVEYYAWYDENTVLYAQGSKIYRQPLNGKKTAWLDVSQYCDTKVSRLNYDAGQQKLAFVCERS